MLPRVLRFAVFALVLTSHLVTAQDDEEFPDDDGEMDGYGGDQDDYGGGGGEDYGGAGGGDARELLSLDDFQAFIDESFDASVIAAFTAKEVLDPKAKEPEGWDADEDGEWKAPTIENPMLTAFNTIKSNVYGYRYAFTTAPEVLEKLKSKNGGLYLYRSPKLLSKEHGDRPRERFGSDNWSESAVSNWLTAKSQSLVGYYSAGTKTRAAHNADHTPVLVIFLHLDPESNAKGVSYVLKRARKGALALKGKLRVTVADLDQTELDDFGLTFKSKADVRMAISVGNDRYGAPEGTAFSAAGIEAFAKQFADGELEPYVRPETDYSSDAGADDDYPPADETAAAEEEELKDEP